MRKLTDNNPYMPFAACCIFIFAAFLYKPQESDTSEVSITFPQITQKILSEDIIHWLELITEILNFLF